jgi:hypothetical protein
MRRLRRNGRMQRSRDRKQNFFALKWMMPRRLSRLTPKSAP